MCVCVCVCVRVRTVTGRAAGERCRCRCSASRGGCGLLFAGSEAWSVWLSVDLLACLLACLCRGAKASPGPGQARLGVVLGLWPFHPPLELRAATGSSSNRQQTSESLPACLHMLPVCVPGTPYSYIAFYTTHARCTHDARCQLKKRRDTETEADPLCPSHSVSLPRPQVQASPDLVSLPPPPRTRAPRRSLTHHP